MTLRLFALCLVVCACAGPSTPDDGPAEPGEWRIFAAFISTDPWRPDRRVQFAHLRPIEFSGGSVLGDGSPEGDLFIGVRCANGIVEQVAVGFQNTPPEGVWVHGALYLRVGGGPLRSNWSQSRAPGDMVRWRGWDDELELLDGTRLLERLATSARLTIEAGPFPDQFSMSAVFDGSETRAALDRMNCRAP